MKMHMIPCAGHACLKINQHLGLHQDTHIAMGRSLINNMSPTAVHGDKCPATFPCQDISSDVDGQNAVLIVMVAQTSDQAQAWLETVQISDKRGYQTDSASA